MRSGMGATELISSMLFISLAFQNYQNTGNL